MPIAKVRIAPIEQWCEALKQKAVGHEDKVAKMIGKPMEIMTHTMHDATDKRCTGRVWNITPASKEFFSELLGITCDRLIPCEHMLEMD